MLFWSVIIFASKLTGVVCGCWTVTRDTKGKGSWSSSSSSSSQRIICRPLAWVGGGKIFTLASVKQWLRNASAPTDRPYASVLTRRAAFRTGLVCGAVRKRLRSVVWCVERLRVCVCVCVQEKKSRWKEEHLWDHEGGRDDVGSCFYWQLCERKNTSFTILCVFLFINKRELIESG